MQITLGNAGECMRLQTVCVCVCVCDESCPVFFTLTTQQHTKPIHSLVPASDISQANIFKVTISNLSNKKCKKKSC